MQRSSTAILGFATNPERTYFELIYINYVLLRLLFLSSAGLVLEYIKQREQHNRTDNYRLKMAK